MIYFAHHKEAGLFAHKEAGLVIYYNHNEAGLPVAQFIKSAMSDLRYKECDDKQLTNGPILLFIYHGSMPSDLGRTPKVALKMSSVGIADSSMIEKSAGKKHLYYAIKGHKDYGKFPQKTEWKTLIEWLLSLSKRNLANITTPPLPDDRNIRKFLVTEQSIFIALSILCQGYLAAHDPLKLPKGISINQDKTKSTEENKWWAPLRNATTVEEKIMSELTTPPLATNAILALAKLIDKNINIKPTEHAITVDNAYGQLVEILKNDK